MHDELSEKIDKLILVVCGDMKNPEDSISAKVNILFNERKERRAFNNRIGLWALSIALTFVGYSITQSFYIGQQTEQVKNINTRLQTVERIIEKI